MKTHPTSSCKITNFICNAIVFLLVGRVIITADTYSVPEPIPRDDQHSEKPEFVQYNMFGNCVSRVTAETHVRFFDVARQIRKISGNRMPAMNVDAFGEVPDCSWFTNRNGKNRMTLEAIVRGAHTGSGPDTAGTWQVIRAKTDGMSPGFWIKDSRNDRYIIKFDPKGYPELTTGAEVISSKILYAAGYNVPENYITVFAPSKVRVGKEVSFTDRRGRKRAMRQSDLDDIFNCIEKRADGLIRAHASKFIEGTPVGSFRFSGTRPDDPNDFIPHEHRRELRGLLVISSWIQHYDNNLSNTFDSYVIKNGSGYVKHYLIDFGGTLGASMHGPQPDNYGNERVLDLRLVLARLFTLGFYQKKWETWDTIPFTSVGAWESKTFEPRNYEFNTPVQSMENITEEDAFWGAKIVMSFSDEQIDALVKEGKYSDSHAERYISRILKERRDKIGRAYFSRLCPLDNFRLESNGESTFYLLFDDLAVKGHFVNKEDAMYRYTADGREGTITEKNATTITGNRIPLAIKQLPESDTACHAIQLQSRHGNEKWSDILKVYLQCHDSGTLPVLVGIQR